MQIGRLHSLCAGGQQGGQVLRVAEGGCQSLYDLLLDGARRCRRIGR